MNRALNHGYPAGAATRTTIRNRANETGAPAGARSRADAAAGTYFLAVKIGVR